MCENSKASMMLTPEQLAEWRDYVRTAKDTLVPMTKYKLCSVLNHIDAQQARIAELEAQLTRIQRLADCGTVQNWLALPDEDKARWFAVTAQRDSEHCKLIADLGQEAARYRWCKDNPDNAASVFDNLGPAYFDSEIDMLMQK